MEIVEEQLDDAIRTRKCIRECAGKDKKFAFEYTFNIFLKILHYYLTPQSYGTRIQNRLLIEYDLEKVSPRIDKGDAKNKKNGKYGEIKISYKDVENKFHFVQIRPHQKCDFYFFYAIDPDINYETNTFIVTSEKIDEVLQKMRASNCHGVSKNKINKKCSILRNWRWK